MLHLWLITALFGFLYAGEQIHHYDVNITLEHSGQFKVTETIDYDFGTFNRHGIFRDIPYQVKYNGIVKDLDITGFTASMDGTPVTLREETYRSKAAGKVIRLYLGNAAEYVTGRHTYTIAYRVTNGILPAAQNPEHDALRWNLVGTGWSIPIAGVTAHIYLPEVLSQNNVSLSTFSGYYGATDTKATTAWRSTHHLEVKSGMLAPHEGLTVELAFERKLLEQSGEANMTPSLLDRLKTQWPFLALLGYLFYFFKDLGSYLGFEDKRAVAVKYLPPKGLSVLQSGLLLDKKADTKDFAAAVIELAQLGYITIEQPTQKSDPILMRTDKSAESLNNNQRYLLDAVLFPNSRVFKLEKGSESIANRLREGFAYINDNLYNWAVQEGYMRENPKKTRLRYLLKYLLLLSPVILLTFYQIYQERGEDVMLLIFPIAFGGVGLQIILTQKSWVGKLQGAVFAVAGSFPLYIFFKEDPNGPLSLLFGPLGVTFLLLAVVFYFYQKVGEMTQKGAYAQKHLLGLERFVKRVKEDEIRRRLALDPLYLDKMLPYAMLFGHTDHWLKFYNLLQVDTPVWYSGNINNLDRFDRTMQQSATPPSSQGSAGTGFGGGGGFSGGGGGGGGGGSW